METRILRPSATLTVLLALLAGAAPAQPRPPEVPGGWVLVDDMILPEEVVVGESVYSATPWPNGCVPYTFDANVASWKRTAAREAMAEWSAVANVHFVPRTSESNYIRFVDSTSNSSQVGMIGGIFSGSQDVNIYNWETRYIICHELNHALGYGHEQCRPDRDTYVTINSGNIQGGMAHNFQIISGGTTVGAYDFLSIMHYPRNAFSTNGNDTITCNAGHTWAQSQIGNRQYMTVLDAQGCAARYGAPPAPSITTMTCNAVAATAGTVLTVNGTRFFRGSPDASGVQGTRVEWNGVPVTTTFVSPTQVTASVPAFLLAVPGVVSVRVRNPAPGGGASAPALFQVQPSTGPVPGVVVSVGAGCGSGPVPPVLAIPVPPAILAPVTIAVANAPANSPGVLVFGLPLPGPVYLVPGCPMYVNLYGPVITLPLMSDASGAATLSFDIPCAPLLVGLSFMGQAGFADGAAPQGLAMTNALLATVGG